MAEGSVGAGTGTVAFGFKGGIGTSSRKLPAGLGGFTVGVLVQSNFGGVLTINGVWAEPTAPKDKVTGKAVGQAIEDLAKFLGATKINYSRKIPAGWKPAIK